MASGAFAEAFPEDFEVGGDSGNGARGARAPNVGDAAAQGVAVGNMEFFEASPRRATKVYAMLRTAPEGPTGERSAKEALAIVKSKVSLIKDAAGATKGLSMEVDGGGGPRKLVREVGTQSVRVAAASGATHGASVEPERPRVEPHAHGEGAEQSDEGANRSIWDLLL